MAQADQNPLRRYLKVQSALDRELARILMDAARDGERRIAALGARQGVSAAVGAAQYARIVLELRRTHAQLWAALTPAIENGLLRAGKEAADLENAVNRLLFGTRVGDTVRALEAAQRAAAASTVRTYMASTDNGIPLSEAVYRVRQLSTGMVDREVARGILLGEGWKEIAGRVKEMIRPDVKGGVSYAAKRLGRTELNNAFHTAQIAQREDSPFTKGFQWHLSGSHPVPDECNEYAEKVHSRGGEPGVFSVGSVPKKPHPNCLCYLTTVLVEDEEFQRTLARGGYDSYLRSKTGRSFR